MDEIKPKLTRNKVIIGIGLIFGLLIMLNVTLWILLIKNQNTTPNANQLSSHQAASLINETQQETTISSTTSKKDEIIKALKEFSPLWIHIGDAADAAINKSIAEAQSGAYTSLELVTLPSVTDAEKNLEKIIDETFKTPQSNYPQDIKKFYDSMTELKLAYLKTEQVIKKWLDDAKNNQRMPDMTDIFQTLNTNEKLISSSISEIFSIYSSYGIELHKNTNKLNMISFANIKNLFSKSPYNIDFTKSNYVRILNGRPISIMINGVDYNNLDNAQIVIGYDPRAQKETLKYLEDFASVTEPDLLINNDQLLIDMLNEANYTHLSRRLLNGQVIDVVLSPASSQWNLSIFISKDKEV